MRTHQSLTALAVAALLARAWPPPKPAASSTGSTPGRAPLSWSTSASTRSRSPARPGATVDVEVELESSSRSS